MTHIIEVAKFRVRPGHEDMLVREHRRALRAIQDAYAGLLRVRLVHLEGDVWADVAEWADEGSAMAAKQGAMSIPKFAHWTRHMIADVSLDHGIVHSTMETRLSAV